MSIGSSVVRSLRVALALGCNVAALSSPKANASYPTCTRSHFGPTANLEELKRALVKAAGPRIAPAPSRFFADALVLVAPVQLRDGHQHVIAYVSSPRNCGSGGCNAYVLERRDRATRTLSYALVGRILPARLPVRVLPTVHHGWRDIGVNVAGGGIVNGYTARLTYGGKAYDSNPTLPTVPHVKSGLGTIVLGAPGASARQCRLR